MIGSSRQIRVWACDQPVSMHKSYDSLRAMAKQAMNRDPLDGDML